MQRGQSRATRNDGLSCGTVCDSDASFRKTKLYYYEQKGWKSELGYIDLSNAHPLEAGLQLKGRIWEFQVVTPERVYFLRAETATEMWNWINTCNSIKEQSAGLFTVFSLSFQNESLVFLRGSVYLLYFPTTT